MYTTGKTRLSDINKAKVGMEKFKESYIENHVLEEKSINENIIERIQTPIHHIQKIMKFNNCTMLMKVNCGMY